MTQPNELPLFAHSTTGNGAPYAHIVACGIAAENPTEPSNADRDEEMKLPEEIDGIAPRDNAPELNPDPRRIRPVADRPSTLAAALAEVKNSAAIDKEALRRITTDLAMVAKFTDLLLDRIPCAPLELRPVLRKVRPARHNLTLRRWRTIKSSISRVLKFVGWVDVEDLWDVAIDHRWRSAVDCLPAAGQKASFAAFARFCLTRHIVPEDVTISTIEEYRNWRAERTLTLDVAYLATTVRRIWGYLQNRHASWPQSVISRSRDPRQTALLPEQFPLSFQAEVDSVIQNMTKVKPLDRRFTRKYARATISNTRNTIFRAASVVAKEAGGPDSIRSLRDVVAPEPFRIIMNEHFDRLGVADEWAPSAKTCAATLTRVARICGTITEAELKELTIIAGMVKPATGGLSARSRDRIAQFYDPAIMAALANLPWKLFKEADQFHNAGLLDRAGRLHARALQLAILLVHPLRRKNLSELDAQRHFTRDRNGLITRFLIPGEETKNGRPIEGLIQRELAERLDRHIHVHRPIFENAATSTYLWPGGDDGHVASVTIARSVKHLVESEIGVDFNVHLVRHIIATLLLEEDPRNMPLAQQLLGHGDVKTTTRIYGHARALGAHKVWGGMLQEIRAKASYEVTTGRRAKMTKLPTGGTLPAVKSGHPKRAPKLPAPRE